MIEFKSGHRALLVAASAAILITTSGFADAAPKSATPISTTASATPATAPEEDNGLPGVRSDEPKSLLDMLRRASRTDDADKPDVETADEKSTVDSARTTAPTTIRALIHKHAAAMGVPVELAEAVVHVESRFNPRARGRAGEVGLMQIKPATARGIGYKGTTKALYDPETNLRWGMLYLAKAYQMAGGDTCGTILRYNGGHAAKRMTKQARTYCGKVNRYVAAL